MPGELVAEDDSSQAIIALPLVQLPSGSTSHISSELILDLLQTHIPSNGQGAALSQLAHCCTLGSTCNRTKATKSNEVLHSLRQSHLLDQAPDLPQTTLHPFLLGLFQASAAGSLAQACGRADHLKQLERLPWAAESGLWQYCSPELQNRCRSWLQLD